MIRILSGKLRIVSSNYYYPRAKSTYLESRLLQNDLQKKKLQAPDNNLAKRDDSFLRNFNYARAICKTLSIVRMPKTLGGSFKNVGKGDPIPPVTQFYGVIFNFRVGDIMSCVPSATFIICKRLDAKQNQNIY